MRLAPSQVQRFYSVWKPLLLFVNERYQLVPGMGLDGPWHIPDIQKLRQALWADDSVLDMFALENPTRLGPKDLDLVKSWRHRVAGKFVMLRQLKKHAIFMRDSKAYAVLALESFFEELVPRFPCYVEAVLLPFEGYITYDTLIAPYRVSFGPGIRASLNEGYIYAKKNQTVTATLPTTAQALQAVRQSKDCAIVA